MLPASTHWLHSFLLLITLVPAVAVAGEPRSAEKTPQPVISLFVDESQAWRRIAFVREEIHVNPGKVALAYPRWIPGEHGPTGPIQQLSALRVHAGPSTLTWTRDLEDINTIYVQVPAGIDTVTVEFDTLLENTISDHQLLLAWSSVLLYPRGIDKREIMVSPSLLLPSKWKQGSSLKLTGQTGDRFDFAPLSLERLIDSPVLAGEFFRSIPLAASWPAVLDITGDSENSIEKANEARAVEIFGTLIDQDRAMFGFRHFETMHLLVSQSRARPYGGVEHEDSPYNAIGDAGLSKKDKLEGLGWPVLAHEQSHAWVGKYRRPAELYSKLDLQGPERTSMLWVYEGLNTYVGLILATRSGFNDAGYARDMLARIASGFVYQSGRSSTPLVDTATRNWLLRNVEPGWSSIRRGQDYYMEGALIWLRADTIIRERSNGKLSLDDFVRRFFGQQDTGPIVVTYTRDDVETALTAICPFDWHTFFETRIYQVNNKPPTDGLEAAGWRIVYNESTNRMAAVEAEFGPSFLGTYSLGMTVKADSTIVDVLLDSPAYKAGLGPQMNILAVNGHVYSEEALTQSTRHPQSGKISLVVRNFESVDVREIQYSGGIRNPHLEQIPGTADVLSEILKAKDYTTKAQHSKSATH
jgi:predicted metalloprotease with PDZ domain